MLAFLPSSSSPAILDQMLSVGISAWIAALNSKDLGLCKEVEYEADVDGTGTGCGKGPISPSRLRRKVRRDNGAVIWERSGLAIRERGLEERCLDNCDPPLICHYTARMCSAPNEISESLSYTALTNLPHVRLIRAFEV